MNYIMLSALIYDVQVNPKKYINKRVKASGSFQTSIYEGERYFSVVVWDPTGCCPAGFDFIPPADMKYPDDFPAIGEKITVTCVFKYVVEDDGEYFILPADEILK